MFYSIGLFVLDSEKEILFLRSSAEVVTSNARTVQLVSCLCNAYPKAISKAELLSQLWPNDEVTEWSLSRLISRVRQILATYDKSNDYIKTVHGQGFKLAVAPILIEDFVPLYSGFDVAINSEIFESASATKETTHQKIIMSRFSFLNRWFFAAGVLGILVLLYFFGKKPISDVPVTYGNMYPGEVIVLPVDSNWVTSKPDTIKFSKDGLLIESISNDIFFVSTPIFRRVFLQGAVFSLKIEASREFIEQVGWLGPYFQTKRDNWPGAWDCGITGKELTSSIIEYDCLIDQNEAFTHVLANEEVVFGIKTYQEHGVSSVLVKSAKVKILPSVDTSLGWHTTKDNTSINYNRGVSYRPESVEQTLSTTIKGPLNIPGSALAFTIEVDKDLRMDYTSIELYLIDKNKLWKNCSVFVNEIKSKIFTTRCKFNSSNPFVLTSDEKIEIGIRPHGKIIAGEIKIIGITVTD